jgi:hypothetical protein
MRSTWRRSTKAGRASAPVLEGMSARMPQRLTMCTSLSICETERVGDPNEEVWAGEVTWSEGVRGRNL